MADSYGCTECHGYAGEGVEGKNRPPRSAGKGWTAEALGVLTRGDAGILPYTVEQMSDAGPGGDRAVVEYPTRAAGGRVRCARGHGAGHPGV